MIRRRTLVVAAALLAMVAVAAGVAGVPGPWTLVGAAPASPGTATEAPGTAAATPSGTSPAPSPTPTPSATPQPTSSVRPSILDRTGIRERLQAALDDGRAELAAPGVVATVLDSDERQWTGISGVADLATGRSLRADTPFAIASVSKTFLAAEPSSPRPGSSPVSSSPTGTNGQACRAWLILRRAARSARTPRSPSRP